MHIVDPPVTAFSYGVPAGNSSRARPVPPPQAASTVDAERRAGSGQLPGVQVRNGQLLPPTAIPNDWAAATRFVGGRAGAVYDRHGNAVQTVDTSPAVSTYLSHSQAESSAVKVGSLVNAFV